MRGPRTSRMNPLEEACGTVNVSESTDVRNVRTETESRAEARAWPLRDRSQWAVVVVLPFVLAVVTMVTEDLRDSVKDLFSSPPALAVTAPEGLDGCVNEYYPMSEEQLRRADRRSYTGAEGPPPGVLMVRRAGEDRDDPVLGVTLQGPSAAAIVVTGVEAEIMSNRPMPTMGTVREPNGCGGLMPKRVFDLHLRTQGSTVRPARGAADFPFKVAGADPEYLEFHVHTDMPRDLRFRLRVRWVTEGEARESVLDGDGKGFRIMGPHRLPMYTFDEQGRDFREWDEAGRPAP